MTDIQPRSQDRIRVVSLQPDVVDHDLAVRRIAELVGLGHGGYVCFSTVHMVMESYDSPEFAARVNAADLIVTDGMPIVWMQRLQGKRHARRVRANDLMVSLCRFAEEKDLSVGFYGGAPAVIAAIKDHSARDFPQLTVAYAYSPPFRPLTPDEDEKIVADINAARLDILFMGLGCPKQENWMSEHRSRLGAVMLGVGASFDFYAGNVKESPEWLGRLGLEWLYRFTQEPRRLWRRYLILNPRFMWLAFLQLTHLKKFER
ncbi:MAG TPA: WecB/TagA/CpsF family glycosyltransferase [Pyrinomonadaceae bacterium]|nr:WecB/TagA/CpsF family glycosyltransferase [Pyrinomonadaceae bacterium]